MKFLAMGSGSSGNCYYICNDLFGIIIDQGIGIRKFKRYVREYGINGGRINAMLVTHAHTDHVKAVGATAQALHIPVYTADIIHKGMERNYLMKKKVPADFQMILNPGEQVTLGPFTVEAFAVPHDSQGNNGYFISDAETSFCLMTDCGAITEEMGTYIARAEHLVIEANYDPVMLARGRYPIHLQKRISNGTGHSSNFETGQALLRYLTPKTKHIWLCHLSEENNNPELCLKTITDLLTALPQSPIVQVLRRTIPTGTFHLTAYHS